MVQGRPRFSATLTAGESYDSGPKTIVRENAPIENRAVARDVIFNASKRVFKPYYTKWTNKRRRVRRSIMVCKNVAIVKTVYGCKQNNNVKMLTKKTFRMI